MILAGDGSVLRPSTVRSRQPARPRVPVGPTATAALEPAHGSLALDFRCQPPSDRRQWAPPAGGRLRQNTRTGQASAQMRATASTRATAGAGTAGQPPIACWPRTHRFWTNLSAPSPPQASSGPRQRGAGFLSGMGVGGGGAHPGSPASSRGRIVIQTGAQDLLLMQLFQHPPPCPPSLL